MSKADTHDDEIERIVESLQPDEGLRRACLQIMASAIRTAHRANPDLWGITPYSDRIRVAVGRLAACTLHRGSVWVALDVVASIAPPRWPSLRPSPGNLTPEVGVPGPRPVLSGYYRPSEADLRPPRQVINRLNAAFIERAAESGRGYNHPYGSLTARPSCAICAGALQEDLPDPAFA